MAEYLGLALLHRALVADAIGRVSSRGLAPGSDGRQSFLGSIELATREGEGITRRRLKGLLGAGRSWRPGGSRVRSRDAGGRNGSVLLKSRHHGEGWAAGGAGLATGGRGVLGEGGGISPIAHVWGDRLGEVTSHRANGHSRDRDIELREGSAMTPSSVLGSLKVGRHRIDLVHAIGDEGSLRGLLLLRSVILRRSRGDAGSTRWCQSRRNRLGLARNRELGQTAKALVRELSLSIWQDRKWRRGRDVVATFPEVLVLEVEELHHVVLGVPLLDIAKVGLLEILERRHARAQDIGGCND
jgi:hypothetical protein